MQVCYGVKNIKLTFAQFIKRLFKADKINCSKLIAATRLVVRCWIGDMNLEGIACGTNREELSERSVVA